MKHADLLTQLARCQAAELIRRVQSEPELEFWFRHALVQEAAYESLLKTTRAELHGKVAAAIEESAMDRREANAAVLALHFERAGLDAKAFPYAVMAGDRARDTFAHREAVGFYDMALAMAERMGDPSLTRDMRRIYVRRGRVLEVAGDHPGAEANYTAMLESAKRAGDLAMQADALNHLVTVQTIAGGRAADLLDHLAEATTLARQSSEGVLEGRALWNMGLYYRFRDPPAAVPYFEEALALARAAGREDVQMRELEANTLIDLSVCYIVRGQLRRSLAARQQAVLIYRELDNPSLLADALGGLALNTYFMGDPAQALEYAREATQLSEQIDNPWGVVYSGWARLELDLDAGRFETVLENSARHLELARKVGFPVFTGMALTSLARANAELGQFALAIRLADQARDALRSMDTPSWTVWGEGIAGRARLTAGDVEGAGAYLAPLWQPGDDPADALQGYLVAGPGFAEWSAAAGNPDLGLAYCDWLLRHAEPEGAWRFVGEVLYERGKILLALEDVEQAEADLLRARELLERANAPALLWRIEAALAEVCAAAGKPDRQEAASKQAKVRIARLADGIKNDSLRQSFLSRPDVRRVLDA